MQAPRTVRLRELTYKDRWRSRIFSLELRLFSLMPLSMILRVAHDAWYKALAWKFLWIEQLLFDPIVCTP